MLPEIKGQTHLEELRTNLSYGIQREGIEECFARLPIQAKQKGRDFVTSPLAALSFSQQGPCWLQLEALREPQLLGPGGPEPVASETREGGQAWN